MVPNANLTKWSEPPLTLIAYFSEAIATYKKYVNMKRIEDGRHCSFPKTWSVGMEQPYRFDLGNVTFSNVTFFIENAIEYAVKEAVEDAID